MEPTELNKICCNMISNWGKEDHNLRFLKLTSEEKTSSAKTHFPDSGDGPHVKRALFNNYDFFRQIHPYLVTPLWNLKQAIMKCETNEDYVKMIIRIEEFKKEEKDDETNKFLNPLFKKLLQTIKYNRKFTPKEKAQIETRLLSSKSDSTVNASEPSSSLPRQTSG